MAAHRSTSDRAQGAANEASRPPLSTGVFSHSDRPADPNGYVFGARRRSTPLAEVHLGTRETELGFTRDLVLARVHDRHAKSAATSLDIVQRARRVARVRHASVVTPIDLVSNADGLVIVFPIEHGITLRELLAARPRVEGQVAAAIVVAVLRGLEAAHEATDENGLPMNLLHDHLSVDTVEIGYDGVVRVLDLGFAVDGEPVGSACIAPEHVRGEEVDRRVDVFGAGAVLWELLTGHPLYSANPPRLSSVLAHGYDERLDAVLAHALCGDPGFRFPTCGAMANALESALPPVSTAELAGWLAMARPAPPSGARRWRAW